MPYKKNFLSQLEKADISNTHLIDICNQVAQLSNKKMPYMDKIDVLHQVVLHQSNTIASMHKGCVLLSQISLFDKSLPTTVVLNNMHQILKKTPIDNIEWNIVYDTYIQMAKTSDILQLKYIKNAIFYTLQTYTNDNNIDCSIFGMQALTKITELQNTPPPYPHMHHAPKVIAPKKSLINRLKDRFLPFKTRQ